jgi:hypothetical protein
MNMPSVYINPTNFGLSAQNTVYFTKITTKNEKKRKKETIQNFFYISSTATNFIIINQNKLQILAAFELFIIPLIRGTATVITSSSPSPSFFSAPPPLHSPSVGTRSTPLEPPVSAPITDTVPNFSNIPPGTNSALASKIKINNYNFFLPLTIFFAKSVKIEFIYFLIFIAIVACSSRNSTTASPPLASI